MAKIVTVYTKDLRENDRKTGRLVPLEMSYIRWFKISEALARLGHKVDMATGEFRWWQKYRPINMNNNLRRVALSKVKWADYDVVKTLFFIGFQTLKSCGGIKHPFIISKLGSVVSAEDAAGIYFYGKKRKQLYRLQEEINQTSRFIALLTEEARNLWYTCFGKRKNVLVVPTGVDEDIPAPSRNPYPDKKKSRCLFAGNVYDRYSQPEANKILIEKMNLLGQMLLKRGVALYLLGPGEVRGLDNRFVTYLGSACYEESWNYLYFANVGIVLPAGEFSQNNESSKIYHYLRAGLPVVAESGFPNQNLITESGLGFIAENGNYELMAEKIAEAADRNWDRKSAVGYILSRHTWDKRAAIYDKVIKEELK